MKLLVLKDIIIKKGTIIDDAGYTKHEYAESPMEYIYSLGKDGCAYFTIPKKDWIYRKDLFKAVE